MEDAWRRKRETRGSSRSREEGEREGKVKVRKSLSGGRKILVAPLWVAMSRWFFASYIIANWIRTTAQPNGVFRPRRTQHITFSLPSDNAPVFRSLCIIFPLIKEHGWICEFMHTTVTETVLVKSTRVSIPAERSPIMLGIQANDFVSVW